jgi:hypothetical protein
MQLAGVLERAGKRGEAERVTGELVGVQERALGGMHPDTRESRERLERLRDGSGK